MAAARSCAQPRVLGGGGGVQREEVMRVRHRLVVVEQERSVLGGGGGGVQREEVMRRRQCAWARGAGGRRDERPVVAREGRWRRRRAMARSRARRPRLRPRAGKPRVHGTARVLWLRVGEACGFRCAWGRGSGGRGATIILLTFHP